MKNFKLNLLAIATIISCNVSASNIYEYNTKNLKEVYENENVKYDTYIVKFKDIENHKNLKRIPETGEVSPHRDIGISLLSEIESLTGITIIHSRSLILNRDSFKINSKEKNVIKRLLNTGYFENIEKSNTVNALGFSKKRITQTNSDYKANSVELGKYNDLFWSLQTTMGDRKSPNLGLSNIEKSKDNFQNNLGRKIRIAVIDSGSYPHEDVYFVNEGYDFTTIQGIKDEDGNNLPKLRDNDPTETDATCISGHGLAVAGLIGAVSNNSKGIVGAMNSNNVELIPVKAMVCEINEEEEKTYGKGLDIVSAIYWSAGGEVEGIPDIKEPADIINLSLGGEGECSSLLQDVIDYAVSKGTVVAVSAGNDAQEAKEQFPANCNNVLTIASVSLEGDLSSFSNYGEKVTSSVVGEEWILPYIDTKLHNESEGNYKITEYGEMQGTSFSTPALSAIVGNIKIKYPEMNPFEIKELIQRTSNKPEVSNKTEDSESTNESEENNEENNEEKDIVEAPLCKEKGCGSGIVDAERALTALDDRTNVYEGDIKHKYAGYNSLPEYKYLLELDKSTGLSSCDLYVARWGLLTQEYNNILHRIYVSTSEEQEMTSSNSDLLKIVTYPHSVVEIKKEQRIGVQICENSYCGKIFELDKPESDIPIYCESYITD